MLKLKTCSHKFLRTISIFMICFVTMLSISVPGVLADEVVNTMTLSAADVVGDRGVNFYGSDKRTAEPPYISGDNPAADTNWGLWIKWDVELPVNGDYTFTLNNGGWVNSTNENVTIGSVTYPGNAYAGHLEIDGVDYPTVNNGTARNMSFGTFNLRKGKHTIKFESDCRSMMYIYGIDVTYVATPMSLVGDAGLPSSEAIVSEDSEIIYEGDEATGIMLNGWAEYTGRVIGSQICVLSVMLEEAGEVGFEINGEDYGIFTVDTAGRYCVIDNFTLNNGENKVKIYSAGNPVVLKNVRFKPLVPGYTPESGLQFSIDPEKFIQDPNKYADNTPGLDAKWNYPEYAPVEVAKANGDYVVAVQDAEYLTYNIDVPEDGVYMASIKFSTDPNVRVNMRLTSGDEILAGNVQGTSSYSEYLTRDIGTIKLAAGETELKYEQTAGVANVAELIFKQVDTDLKVYSAFANNSPIIKNSYVERGTDVIDVYCTNNLTEQNITGGIVTLKAGNKSIPVELKVDGVKLEVLLKDTLDYTTAYTLTIEKLFSQFGELSEVKEITFTTTDNLDDMGSSTVEVSEVKEQNNALVVSGVVKSSKAVPIAGRYVKIKAEVDGELYNTYDAGLSQADGVFTYSIDMTDAPSGVYSVYVMPEYSSYTKVADIAYISADDEAQALSELKDTTEDTITQWFNTYKDDLGLTLMVHQGISNMNTLYNYFVGADYSDKATFAADYEKYMVMERLLQGNSTVIANVLADSDACAKLGINGAKTALLTGNNKTGLTTDLFNLTGITAPDDYIEKYDEVVNVYLFKQSGKAVAELKVENKSANLNMSVEIPVEFVEKQDNVKGAIVNVECADTDVIESFELDLTASGATAVKTVADDKKSVKFDVEIDYATSVTKLGTLTFNALKTGTYTLKLNSAVVYELTGNDYDGNAITANATKELDSKNVSVSVTEYTTGSSGGGVSSWGGSSGSGGSSSSDKNDKDDENKEDENKETENNQGEAATGAFGDLADFDWAVESIESLTDAGVISKSEDGKFYPERAVTREEFVKMLVIALGFESTDVASDFADVDENEWYAPYIAIAKAQGITTGKADGSFGVGEQISRQDMATLAARALELAGITSEADSDAFADDADIEDYAKAPVYMMKKLGIINGVGDNKFDANGTSNRAMAAKVIFEMRKAVGE